MPLLADFQFLCYELDPVLVDHPRVLNPLGHEAAHVGQHREHEGDPNDAESETEHPSPESRGCEVSISWDYKELNCDGVTCKIAPITYCRQNCQAEEA